MAVVRQIRISQRPGVIRLLLSPWALVHHRTQVLAREWEKQGAQLFVTPVLHHAEQAKSLLVAHEYHKQQEVPQVVSKESWMRALANKAVITEV